MKSDNNPSILFLAYGNPKEIRELEEELQKKFGNVRELKLIDIAISLEKKDELLNYLKSFMWLDYWKDRTPLKFKIVRWISEKLTSYKSFDLNKFEKWERDSCHKFNNIMLCPLLYQYPISHCTNEKEIQSLKELAEFKSKNYKPKLLIKNNEDFKDYTQSNKRQMENNTI